MKSFEFTTANVEATESLGEAIGASLEIGTVIALDGDLGAGKTAITRGITRGMGLSDFVSSPTFTIVNEYVTGEVPLYHFDTYRLADEEDFLNSGLDEYFYNGGVCVIEWSSVISEILPEDTVKIIIKGVGDSRTISVTAPVKFDKLISALQSFGG